MSFRVAAILSMLHEPAMVNSATRLFRERPVLRWTIDRLCRAKSVTNIGILCWDDQLPAVLAIAKGDHVEVVPKGPRRPIAELDRITAAQTWADGWRGGLHGTCWFDVGFHGPWVAELADKLHAEAVLLVPPASAMVDPAIVDALIGRAANSATLEMTFTAAAPGLGAAVVKRPLLKTLVDNRSHPGRLLHYMPERPMLDPVGSEGCVTVPAGVSRTRENFLLDSERKISRFTSAACTLNGALANSDSETLVKQLEAEPCGSTLPRDVTIELNADRLTLPSFMPLRQGRDLRASLDLRAVVELLAPLRHLDDVRLTLGGRGDPLCSPILFDVIAAARAANVASIHVETDLADENPKHIVQLASADIDVVSLYLPALTPDTYAAVMGTDAMPRVMDNLQTFVTVRAARGRGTPLVVPTFVKLASNLAEMDAWYDQWLTALGAAAIVGPAAFGMKSLELADMSPAHGKPAGGRASRRFVSCDGGAVECTPETIVAVTSDEKEVV